jgi:hypothetical protein
MLFLLIPAILVCVVVLWRFSRRHEPTDALGWMSERWLNEHRNSRQ